MQRNGIYVIRSIPQLFVAGQLEPLMVVPKPSRKSPHKLQELFLEFQIARLLEEFDAAGEDATFDDIREHFRTLRVRVNIYQV